MKRVQINILELYYLIPHLPMLRGYSVINTGVIGGLEFMGKINDGNIYTISEIEMTEADEFRARRAYKRFFDRELPERYYMEVNLEAVEWQMLYTTMEMMDDINEDKKFSRLKVFIKKAVDESKSWKEILTIAVNADEEKAFADAYLEEFGETWETKKFKDSEHSSPSTVNGAKAYKEVEGVQNQSTHVSAIHLEGDEEQ